MFVNTRKDGVTRVPAQISRYSFHVFSCAHPSVISSISGKSFYFPFPYFVIFVLWYFPFHMVYTMKNEEYGKNRNIPKMYKGINEFKKCCHPYTYVIKKDNYTILQ